MLSRPEQEEDANQSVVTFEREPGKKVNLVEFQGKKSLPFGAPEAFLLCSKTLLPGEWSRAWGAPKAGGGAPGGGPSVNSVFE